MISVLFLLVRCQRHVTAIQDNAQQCLQGALGAAAAFPTNAVSAPRPKGQAPQERPTGANPPWPWANGLPQNVPLEKGRTLREKKCGFTEFTVKLFSVGLVGKMWIKAVHQPITSWDLFDRQQWQVPVSWKTCWLNAIHCFFTVKKEICVCLWVLQWSWIFCINPVCYKTALAGTFWTFEILESHMLATSKVPARW